MVDSHAKRLVDAGEFRQAAEWLAARPSHSQGDRIVQAYVELELGDVDVAKNQAESILQEHLESRARALCLSISGRALGRLGQTDMGLTRMRQAMLLAAETDRALEAELLSHYVSVLLNWIGIEPALAELPRLRKLALLGGSAHALIEYHIVHAKICVMKGWLQQAERQAQMAFDLLQSSPHLVQLWKVSQVRSNAAIKACDFTSGHALAQDCLDLASASGSTQCLASTLANLAHLSTITGHYETAQAYFDRAQRLLDPSSYLRVGVYSIGLDLALASGDRVLADSMAASGERADGSSPDSRPYYSLFFEVSRVRWLIHCKQYADAACRATNALTAVAKLADSDLLDRMTLLAAEAYALNGDVETANGLFGRVCATGRIFGLETLAETNRLAAVLSYQSDPVTARDFLSRAWRILTAAGLMGGRADVERSSKELNIPVNTSLTTIAETPQALLQTFAAALQVGKHPHALRAELLTLLSWLGMSDDVLPDDHGTGEPHQVRTLKLGSDSSGLHVLRLTFPSDAASQMLCGALEQIELSTAALAAQGTFSEDQPGDFPADASITQLGMVVAADQMRELLDTTRKLAPSSITVLLTGETGTGKELLAHALHEASPRKDKPFIPFNCTAVARDMLDAQLFGYRRGAFTGAHESFQGVIRAAAGGTLFLDEIGEMGLDVQPKLLRFLESGEIHPLGEPKPITVDVRVVAATNANLEKLVDEGRFRQDLFYRLNVVRLQVPPLRERREEIPPLVQHFLDKSVRESRKTGLRFAEQTMEYLVLHKWPGNVRQLANEIRRLVALAEPGAVLMPEHLSADIRASRRTIPATERTPDETEFVVRLDQPMNAAMEHVERAMVQYALKHAGGRFEDAAQLLGLSRKGLYLKRQRLGLAEVTPDDAHLAAARSTA